MMMKKQMLAAALLAAGSGMSYAQSSVTIYGLIDVGLTYYANAAASGGGKASMVRVDSGVSQGSRFGFRGGEDLGAGRSAFFTLESGFNPDDGSIGQGGVFFGRQAFVGLRDAELGSISLGRQYDFMLNLGVGYAMGVLSPAGSFAWGLHADSANRGALSDRVFGDRTNNAIKYESVKLGGATFGLMYGLGEVAGNSRASRTVSARAGYDDGPFSSGVAYTDIKNATGSASTRTYGWGASYQVGSLRPFGLVTQVKNTGTSAKATTFELGAIYGLSNAFDLGGAYQMRTRNGGVGNSKALVGSLDYKLSKRTDVYLLGVYNRDRGYNAFPILAGVQSSSGVQSNARVGIRHRF